MGAAITAGNRFGRQFAAEKIAGDLRFKQLEQHEEIRPFVRNWEQVYLALLNEEVKRCSKS